MDGHNFHGTHVRNCITLTNYKTNCYIVRKSDAITDCQQLFISYDWCHFDCKWPANTETSTTGSKPKLSLMSNRLFIFVVAKIQTG